MNEVKRCVLVTGAAGTIGRRVCQALIARGHSVRGFDRAPMPQLPDAVVGQITDRGAVERAMQAMDTLIHLAATTDEADFINDLLQPNVAGLYQVMDLARQLKLRRVVLASSVQVIRGIDLNARTKVTTQDVMPTNHYALTKLWAEQMGQMYHRQFGMSVIAARIGWVPHVRPQLQHTAHHQRLRELYLSHADTQQFFTRAVEAEPIDFALLYAVGPGIDGTTRIDLAPARDAIGFQPQHEWPHGFVD